MGCNANEERYKTLSLVDSLANINNYRRLTVNFEP